MASGLQPLAMIALTASMAAGEWTPPRHKGTINGNLRLDVHYPLSRQSISLRGTRGIGAPARIADADRPEGRGRGVSSTKAINMADSDVTRFPMRTPRVWHGMTFPVWMRLLASHRFAISPARLPMACIISGFSVFNSLSKFIEEACFARRAARLTVVPDPVFVIGHWRTGTTLLHELLVLDDQFSFPSLYQCMAPHHFLHTSWFVTRFLGFLLPNTRPMDNVSIGWNRPQEDEFALGNLGTPSPYLDWAFPNHPRQNDRYLDLEGLTAAELQHWKDTMQWFVRRLTYHDPRRLVLKSPTHTARIKTLLELYPRARFIHIVRDPYVVLPSTFRMWRKMADVLGLQIPRHENLEDTVFRTYTQMYRSFDQQRHLVDPTRIVDVRYEDLVENPVAQMERIYQHLSLKGFDQVAPKLREYWQQGRDYRTNKYEPSAELRGRISEHCRSYMDTYGYQAAGASVPLEKAG